MKRRKKIASLVISAGMIIGFFSTQLVYSQIATINVGLRVGINALAINHDKVYLEDLLLSGSSYQNKVGYHLCGFLRFNLDNVFIQPELSGDIYRKTFSFAIPGTDETVSLPFSLSDKSYVASISSLIGYTIQKDGPFLINVYLGPSMKYLYRSEYDLNSNASFTDKEPYYRYTGIVGFSFNVSKVHFDLRYEINLTDSNIHFDDQIDLPDALKQISLKKSENVLSFSIGVMF
ncbi:MAG: PorT family protein [Dysgonamonadaceae bacterium]|nr:PorT family protein [Dysgonamonadaceae bacterium]